MPRDRKKIRRLTYRGLEEEDVMVMPREDLFKLFTARKQRKLRR